jgi:hypothetical protein
VFYCLANEISKKSWGVEEGGHGFAGRVPEAELRKLAEQNRSLSFRLRLPLFTA